MADLGNYDAPQYATYCPLEQIWSEVITFFPIQKPEFRQLSM